VVNDLNFVFPSLTAGVVKRSERLLSRWRQSVVTLHLEIVFQGVNHYNTEEKIMQGFFKKFFYSRKNQYNKAFLPIGHRKNFLFRY
jgi:hypothetical protein